MGNHEGRHYVVTGSASGIGAATAVFLASAGAKLTLMDIDEGRLNSVGKSCRSHGAKVRLFAFDLSIAESVERAVRLMPETEAVHGVFSNAGFSMVKGFIDTTDIEWEKLWHVNVVAGARLLRLLVPKLAESGSGSIVCTASELAVMGQKGYVPYSATKGAVQAMVRALAAELCGLRIRVNSVSPGAIDTPLLAQEFDIAANPQSEREAAEKSIAMGRFGKPEEIAETVAFLLSTSSSYVTGANFVVDGGRTSIFP